MTHRSFRNSLFAGAALGLLLCNIPASAAPKDAPEKPKSALPDYPQINVSVSYEVDPNWPQPRPENVKWGHVPSISIDKQDNVWIFTRAEPPVQVYSPEGKLIRTWGQGTVGIAHGLRFDNEGNVWIGDAGNHTVRKCTPEGKVLLTLGTPGERGLDDHHLNMPTDIAISPQGEIFVSDGYGNSRVVHFDKTGKFVKAWGALGISPRQFSCVHSIVLDSKGRLYVADRNNVRIQVYSQEGELLDSWNNIVTPWTFWISDKDELWVCGSSPETWRARDPKYPGAPLGCPPKDQLFMRLNTDGKIQQLWTIPKGEDDKEKPGDLNWVHGIALDSKGNIFAGDIIGKRVQKFVRKESGTPGTPH